jgi:hypothetical protein
MRGGWLRRVPVAVLTAIVVALVACAAMEEAEKRDRRTFSAERLGDPDVEADMLANTLGEPERAAARRAGIPVADADAAAADDPVGSKTEGTGAHDEGDPDKAGKIGVALLSVGVTLGMLAAPFFLY